MATSWWQVRLYVVETDAVYVFRQLQNGRQATTHVNVYCPVDGGAFGANAGQVYVFHKE